MRALLLPLLLALVSPRPARAASRMVIHAPGTVTVVMDNRPVSSAGNLGRTTLSAVTPGRHELQLRDTTGQVLYKATIEVPDNASVTATWDGAAMTLVGAHEVSALSAEPPSAFRDPADVAPEPDDAALQAANDQEHGNQLASAHGQGEVRDTHAVGGRIPYEVSQAAGTVASAAIGTPSLLSSPVASAASAVGGGFVYMINTAEAGGIRKRYSPDARQGNPNVPPPILEEVKLVNLGGQPMSVYVDGMWLYDFAAGQTEKSFKIEVGRRELFFVDPQRKQIVHQGSLRIKEDYVIVLEFSPTQAPRATNANWAWAPM
ncbi:hypothetical protein L6R53_15345 [Myxococcota bacterium]|nr:hypothetical protein [Myxococcota bacterium]